MPRLPFPLVVFVLAKLVFFAALYVYWNDVENVRETAASIRVEASRLLASTQSQSRELDAASSLASEAQLSTSHLATLIARIDEADSRSWIAPLLLIASVVVFTVVLAYIWLVLKRSRRETRRADEAMRSLQSLLAGAPFAFMAWNSRRGTILWSDAAERMFGLPRGQVLGQPLPDALASVSELEACTRRDIGTDDTPTGVAMQLHDGDGVSLHASVSLSRLPKSGDGSDTVAAVIEDVTPRLLRETRRLDAVRAQRDALVREVHHRIKNHLQGIAGLLRQHLSGKPLLQPLLEVTTAQVLSIAAVHGLQGEVRRGAPNLRMLLARIASSVSGIMHVPIEMAGQCMTIGDTLVTEEEAVPIAMVLNELMMNAIKHRALIGEDATVRIDAVCNVGGVQIEISNAGVLPARFNLPLGVHVGTGLGLVKSLLPQRGAVLEIVEEGRRVVARLTLLTPEVLMTPAPVTAEN